jgi:uncharacterized protein (DUF983 family)
MDVTALLVALIYIAIICVVGGVVIRIIPDPKPSYLTTIIWAIVTIVCLVILLQVITGHSLNFR